MSTDSGFGKVKFFDDFLGDTINLDWYIVNADAGGTAVAVVEAENGVVRGLSDGTNGDIQNIFGAENWQPSVQGTIIFEARVALHTSLAQGIFIGLTDDNDADEVPIDDDGGTLTTTASDAVGFVYDSAGNGTWDCVSVKADSDGAQVQCPTKFNPVLDTFQTFRIVVEDDGNCRYYINGEEITASGAARSAAITTTVQYCPCVAQLANGTAADFDIDYFYVEGGRA